MKKKASGFYNDSLEMLLDTMCDMLGGIIFIALMVALVAQDTPAPKEQTYRQQSATLSNQLAAIAMSNSTVEAQLASLVRLQSSQQHFRTNVMRLPNLTDTSSKHWDIIVQYGKLFPIYTMPSAPAARPVRSQAIDVGSDGAVQTRANMGEDAEQGIARMAAAFRAGSRTNYYFAFWVYEDSFDAFVRARDNAARLGFLWGWEPLPSGQPLRLGRSGQRVLPQN